MAEKHPSLAPRALVVAFPPSGGIVIAARTPRRRRRTSESILPPSPLGERGEYWRSTSMAQLKHVVEPFGEVNVYPQPGGRTRVVATILMEPQREGTQTGIALDGSGSMAKLYGVGRGGVLSSIFGQKPAQNEITPVAQKICAYLARKLDADGGTTCIYWAVGPGGGQVEVVGDLSGDEA